LQWGTFHFQARICDIESANRYRRSKTSAFDCRATLKLVTLLLSIIPLVTCARPRDPQTIYNRAWDAYQHGDLVRAEQEADKGYSDTHSSSSEWAWKFVILRARILYQRGLYEATLKLLSSELPPPSGELLVQKYRFEGMADTSLHLFPEAEQKFGEADRVCASSNYSPCADVVAARGMLEMARGNYSRGGVLFGRVLTIARASGDRVWEAETLLNLSWAADEQTHYDEALDRAESARDIALANGIADVSQTAAGNIGWAYYKLGDLEKARTIFAEAGTEASRVGNLADQIRWLTDAGYVEMDFQEFGAADRSFQQSLGLARQVKLREAIINSLIALAFLSEQTNKPDDASRYANEALSMAKADSNKRDATYPRLVQGRVAAQQHDPAAAEAAFREVEQSPDAPVFLKWEAQRSLARLYEDENQIDAAGKEYRTALRTFEEARSELQRENSRLPFLNNATRIYDDYIQFLVKQHKSDEALQVAEYNRARTLNEGLGLLKIAQLKGGSSFQPGSLNASQIARKVGGVIFFYWLGEKQSYLWGVTPQKTALFPLPPAAEIQASVQRYRKALLGPLDPVATSNDDGLALYRMLVEPAASLLKKDAKVFIIPDGSLNTLNFETLLVPGPSPHYWIEDVAIADASSLRMLAAARADNKPTGSLLLIGDAVSPNADYPELRKASAEIENVDKHFPPAQQQIFARERATPEAYLASKPEQFSYIHFVAHGTASRTSPLDSAIVLSRTGLSKAGAADDSFKLYARDIIHHPLHAELVTISTCYGAGSRAYSGEGLVGLSWAFLREGAHNVIGALWEVSDVSTPGLMDDLYSGLRKGNSPGAALRAAKLSLLHSGGSFAKPFYWAPFQLYTGS
jgi:CHAT domain-containing protein